MNLISKIKHVKIITKSFPRSNIHLHNSINTEHLKLGDKFAQSLSKYFPSATFELHSLMQFLSRKNPIELEDDTLVITIGGDGTFLHSAHKIKNDKSFILGVNSKPNESIGKLCSFDLIAEGCDDNGWVENKKKISSLKEQDEFCKVVNFGDLGDRLGNALSNQQFSIVNRRRIHVSKVGERSNG